MHREFITKKCAISVDMCNGYLVNLCLGFLLRMLISCLWYYAIQGHWLLSWMKSSSQHLRWLNIGHIEFWREKLGQFKTTDSQLPATCFSKTLPSGIPFQWTQMRVTHACLNMLIILFAYTTITRKSIIVENNFGLDRLIQTRAKLKIIQFL